MLGKSQTRFLVGLAALALPVAAQAQSIEAASAPDSTAKSPVEMVEPYYHRITEYRLDAEGDSVGLALTGIRQREGHRRDCELVSCGYWIRGTTGSAEGWLDIKPDLALTASYAVSHKKYGNTDSSLLALPSGGISQRFELGLRREDTMMTLAVFDRAGWSDPDVADFARRATNGEARARRGVALEYQTERPISGQRTIFAFALERADSSAERSENRVVARLQGRF